MKPQKKKERDYSKGSYIAKDPFGAQIGRIDDSEYVVGLNGNFLYRIDGDEVYTVEEHGKVATLVGYIEDGEVRCPKDYSRLYFTLIEDKE